MMISLNLTAKTALATLQVLRPKPEETGATRQEPSLLSDPLTRVRTGAGVSDALMKISELVSGGGKAAGAERSEGAAEETRYFHRTDTTKDGTVIDFGRTDRGKSRLSDGEGTRVSDLPPDFVMSGFMKTADRVVAQELPQVSDEVFRAGIIAMLKDHHMQDESFLAALANGTLKVQRASDVPELGGLSNIYDLYDAQGRHIGASGAHTPVNREFLAAQKADGLHTSLGTLLGINFYVTWPEKTG